MVGRRIYYEPYNRWIVNLRQAVGLRTVYRSESARKILQVLSRNEAVGLLPDQDIDSLRGVFVDFFGRPAYTPVAPVRLALASGAPIVANFLIREPGDRYRFVAGGVIRPVIETTREEAEKKYTAEWMQGFEKIIRQYPGQWAWMHPRWKTRPDGLMSFPPPITVIPRLDRGIHVGGKLQRESTSLDPRFPPLNLWTDPPINMAEKHAGMTT